MTIIKSSMFFLNHLDEFVTPSLNVYLCERTLLPRNAQRILLYPYTFTARTTIVYYENIKIAPVILRR